MFPLLTLAVVHSLLEFLSNGPHSRTLVLCSFCSVIKEPRGSEREIGKEDFFDFLEDPVTMKSSKVPKLDESRPRQEEFCPGPAFRALALYLCPSPILLRPQLHQLAELPPPDPGLSALLPL